MKNLLLISFISLLFFAVSCRKTDKTKPIFSVISPSDADTFLLSDTVFFNATFTDNEELSQYRAEIKNNFTEDPNSSPAWKMILINSLAGKNAVIQEQLIIPDTIYPGAYFFIVKCTDYSGNEAPADTSEILIQ